MSTKPPSPKAPIAPLRIGTLARRSGRSIHTIRWYDSIGLMPGVIRDAGNRRVFDEQHIGWLALLERLKLTGMTTAEMRAYAELVARGRSTLGPRRDLLAAHRERVHATLVEWRLALELLDRKLAFYDAWISTGHRPAEPEIPQPSSRPRRKAP